MHSQIIQGIGCKYKMNKLHYVQENNNNAQACMEVHPRFRHRFPAREQTKNTNNPSSNLEEKKKKNHLRRPKEDKPDQSIKPTLQQQMP